MNDDRGFTDAQRRYDNAEPNEACLEQCDECDGSGWVASVDSGDDDDGEECSECLGEGVVKL